MNGRFSLRDLGEPPSHAAVLEYLRAHGWTTKNEERHIRCEGPCDDEGQPIVQFFPVSETYADYPLRLEDLICALAAIEDRSAIEIVREMAGIAPAVSGAATPLAEAVCDVLRRSARDVLSDDEWRRLVEILPVVAFAAERDAEGIESAYLRCAVFISRLAGALSDSAGAQLLLGRFYTALLPHFGLQPLGSPYDFADLYRLSRQGDTDGVFTWIGRHFSTVIQVCPPAQKSPTET